MPNLDTCLEKKIFWPFMIYSIDPTGSGLETNCLGWGNQWLLPQPGDKLSRKDYPWVIQWQCQESIWVPESSLTLHCAAPLVMYIKTCCHVHRNFWKFFPGTVGRVFLSLDVSSWGAGCWTLALMLGNGNWALFPTKLPSTILLFYNLFFCTYPVTDYSILCH